MVKDVKKFFKLKQKNEINKDRIIRDIRTLFEQEDVYYNPIRVGNFWNSNYVKHESNDNINKTLPVKEFLNKIKPYLRDVITDLQKSGTWKVQLTIAINLISSIDVAEECVMHSKSHNKEFMIYDNVNDIVDELFKPLLSRYQNNLEISMR